MISLNPVGNILAIGSSMNAKDCGILWTTPSNPWQKDKSPFGQESDVHSVRKVRLVFLNFAMDCFLLLLSVCLRVAVHSTSCSRHRAYALPMLALGSHGRAKQFHSTNAVDAHKASLSKPRRLAPEALPVPLPLPAFRRTAYVTKHTPRKRGGVQYIHGQTCPSGS